jgi:hypothetical protein
MSRGDPMNFRGHGLDGFHLFSGFAAVIAGPVMLASGAPAGWSFLVLASGLVLLLAQLVIVGGIICDEPAPLTIVVCIFAMICLGFAVVYLTRAADDLPSLFPGYDVHSETYRLVPGTVLFAVGTAGLVRSVLGIHPHREVR